MLCGKKWMCWSASGRSPAIVWRWCSFYIWTGRWTVKVAGGAKQYRTVVVTLESTEFKCAEMYEVRLGVTRGYIRYITVKISLRDIKQEDFWKYTYAGCWKKKQLFPAQEDYRNNKREEEEEGECYQIVVVLEGVVQGGDPLAVPIYQHIPLLPKTSRLKKDAIKFVLEVKTWHIDNNLEAWSCLAVHLHSFRWLKWGQLSA